MANNINIELDASEFIKTIREYSAVSKKDAEEVVVDRSGKLAYELFKRFKATAPKVSTLRALPRSLDYRIKRKFAGATVAQEIARRIRARFAAASGWIPAINRFSRRSVTQRKGTVIGSFEINLSEPSVTIINGMKEAVADEAKNNIMQSAIDAQTDDMKVYIERKLEQRARQFSV